jgi:5-formyltetrahydrofolate cyclo-ligase
MDDPRKVLRARLRELRAAIPAATRIAAADAVAENLLRHPAVSVANALAGYWAVAGELPLHRLMARLSPSTRYCLPVLQAERTLRFAPWRTGDAVAANRYGIPEPVEVGVALAPSEIDVVLLPLVGFSRDGHRLGTGGGWYDRSFAFRRDTPAPPLLIGIGFACQQIDAAATIQAREWDVPLDAIATEHELIHV